MKKSLMILATVTILSVAFSSCSILTKSKISPAGFIQTNEVGWSTIQLREGLNFDKAFDEVLDVVAKRFEWTLFPKRVLMQELNGVTDGE